jgi:hypothetical protein
MPPRVRDFSPDWVNQTGWQLSSSTAVQRLSDPDREQLRALYKPHNEQLFALLGRSVCVAVCGCVCGCVGAVSAALCLGQRCKALSTSTVHVFGHQHGRAATGSQREGNLVWPCIATTRFLSAFLTHQLCMKLWGWWLKTRSVICVHPDCIVCPRRFDW